MGPPYAILSKDVKQAAWFVASPQGWKISQNHIQPKKQLHCWSVNDVTLTKEAKDKSAKWA